MAIDSPQVEIAARLREAFEHRKRTEGLTQGKVADLVKVRNNTITEILNGSRDPHTTNIVGIMEVLRVYPNWVILGLVPKYYEDSATALPPVQAPVVLDVERWLSEYKGALSDEDKAWMRAFPWQDPHVRKPDHVYVMALSVRHSQQQQPAPADSSWRK